MRSAWLPRAYTLRRPGAARAISQGAWVPPALDAAWMELADATAVVPKARQDIRYAGVEGARAAAFGHRRRAALDMATPFDFFDPHANVPYASFTDDQPRYRERRIPALARRGVDHARAWCQSTPLLPAPTSRTAYDVPIR